MSPQHNQDVMQHYRVLGLSKAATQDDIKQAYRRLARSLHPDKGGSAEGFAALQAAFETLSDPKARAAYDSLASDPRFRPGAAKPYSSSSGSSSFQQDAGQSPPPGVTEAVLLQQLLQRGAAHPYAVFNPMRQLCVTCEVCTRPATQQCWTCGMDICEFCTRRQHWKGSVSLHWPLVNQPGSMLEQLGKRELELKRQEDGQAYKEAQPDYRPQSELQALRQFQDALVDLLQQQQQKLGGTGATSITPATTAGPGMRLTSSPTDTAISNNSTTTVIHSSSTTVIHSSSTNTTTSSGACSGQKAAAPMPTGPAAALASQQTAFAIPKASVLSPNSNQFNTTTTSSSSSTCLVSRTDPSSSTALAPRTNSNTALAVHSSTPKAVQKCLKAWQEAPEAVRQSMLGLYDNRLARFYMWGQTECSVILALHMPTGGGKTTPMLTVQPTPTTLLIQHKGFAPVLNRAWCHPIDAAAGISSWSSGDGQLLVLTVCKAQPGCMWATCFKGDPHLARHLQSPYRLVQLSAEVQLDLPVPFWVHPSEDLQVEIGPRQLTVAVDGVMTLRRTYFVDAAQADKQGDGFKVVDPSNSSWCLMDQDTHKTPATQSKPSSTSSGGSNTGSSGGLVAAPRGAISRTDKVLSITLALPDPTEEEVMYKKGVRQNNASVVRSCPNGAGKSGMALFEEDEDEWGLHAVLQAVLFHEAGRTWLTAKPWELATGAGSLLNSNSSSSSGGSSQLGRGAVLVAANSGRWVLDEAALPADVARHLRWLRSAAGSVDADTAEAAAMEE